MQEFEFEDWVEESPDAVDGAGEAAVTLIDLVKVILPGDDYTAMIKHQKYLQFKNRFR